MSIWCFEQKIGTNIWLGLRMDKASAFLILNSLKEILFGGIAYGIKDNPLVAKSWKSTSASLKVKTSHCFAFLCWNGK